MNPVLKFAAWSASIIPMPLKRQLYRIPSLASALRRILNQAAPPGLTEVIVASGKLREARLLLNLHSEKDYWLGTYEPELQDALADFVHRDAVVFDVGANIGYISLLCAHLVGPKGRVFAFEALPGNLERLRHNLEINDFAAGVEIIPAAVVDSPRDVRFLIGPSSGMGKVEGSAGRDEFDYPETIRVPGISLDDFIYRQLNPVPQLIKIDIEGGEVFALSGMRRLLADGRPILLMELHGPQSLQTVWDELSRARYQMCLMARPYHPVSALGELEWKSYIVALPDTSFPTSVDGS